VLFVPAGGGPPTRSVRKELLAFLTGVVHGDRLAAEPAELTEDQLERGAARLPGLLLIDSRCPRCHVDRNARAVLRLGRGTQPQPQQPLV